MNKPALMLSKSDVAEKYIEILQPLEELVAYFYRLHPEMHDHDVLVVYQALLKYVRARLTNFALPQHTLKGLSLALYDEKYLFLEDMQETYSLEEIQICLKQLEKSAKLWNRELGSRGYLNFILQFN